MSLGPVWHPKNLAFLTGTLTALVTSMTTTTTKERTMTTHERAATAVAESSGIPVDYAEHVLECLELDDECLEYVAEDPTCVTSWDDDSIAGRISGATGWVVWFDSSGTARSVSNADPVHHEQVYSLADAVSHARGVAA